MNNYPDGVDMSRILDYPDYTPSEDALEAYDLVAAVVEGLQGTKLYEEVKEWAEDENDSINRADFNGNLVKVDPFYSDTFVNTDLDIIRHEDNSGVYYEYKA